MSEFKFTQPENTACFVCNHILEHGKQIMFLSHDKEDSSWQFLCGREDHSISNIRIISLKEATQIDLTINQMADLPVGMSAKRKNNTDVWKVMK